MCFKYVLIVLVLLFLVYPSSAWVSGYNYRMPIEINNTGDVLTNWQYNFTVDTAALYAAGKLQYDGRDCCVADSSDVLQPFWNENAFNLTDTMIWVNASSLDNVTNTTHYFYYGKSGASALMNGTTTFEFFDDFKGGMFEDGYATDIINTTLSAYGEPTALGDDGQIDLWYWGGSGQRVQYTNSTNGIDFTTPVDTDVDAGWGRLHILKHNGTYYLYVVDVDASSINLRLYTGTNKINFTSQGTVFSRDSGIAWENTMLGNIFVWVENTSDWKMMYEAKGSEWKIGLATSTNGTSWTRYGSNPVIDGTNSGNPELARTGSTILKHNSKYYCYTHEQIGTTWEIHRWNSSDLHTWADEGEIDGIIKIPAAYSHGDHALVEFDSNTYLFWSPSNQVDTAWINVAIDDLNYTEILSVTPDYTSYDITDKWIGDTSFASVANGTLTYIGDSNWRRMYSKDGATEKTFGPTMAGRFKVSTSSQFGEIGFSPNPCCDHRIIVYNTGYVSHDGAAQEITTGKWSYSTEYTFDIKQIGGVSDKFYLNNVLDHTHTTNPGNGAVPVEVASYSASVICDWIFVHKHTATEPITVLGAEESAPSVSVETITVVIL